MHVAQTWLALPGVSLTIMDIILLYLFAVIYQKRFKKERKLRRKLEHELQQNQQYPQQSQQSAVSLNLSSLGVNKSVTPLGQSNGGTNVPVNTLTSLGNSNKSPVSSLPPTPPTHTASSDEAD